MNIGKNRAGELKESLNRNLPLVEKWGIVTFITETIIDGSTMYDTQKKVYAKYPQYFTESDVLQLKRGLVCTFVEQLTRTAREQNTKIIETSETYNLHNYYYEELYKKTLEHGNEELQRQVMYQREELYGLHKQDITVELITQEAVEFDTKNLNKAESDRLSILLVKANYNV